MILFLSTFVMVFLMAFQQQNVIHSKYKMAALTSFAIAIFQFSLYKEIITSDYIGILYMGLGGALGVTLSMYTHTKWRNKE